MTTRGRSTLVVMRVARHWIVVFQKEMRGDFTLSS